MIDSTDLAIANILQSDARTSNAEIARRVGMAPSAVFERIRKLEERGVIRGYHARLDPRAVGYGLLAFIAVRSDECCGAPETERRLAQVPEVLEIHHVVGEDCFLVKVRVRDIDALSALLRDTFGQIGHIRSTRTTIVLHTPKDTYELPIASAGAAGAAGAAPAKQTNGTTGAHAAAGEQRAEVNRG
ncbi:MAG TPA: Lrp/AsnC family transcriptional regulator [Gemmatimonadaceae bacterium]